MPAHDGRARRLQAVLDAQRDEERDKGDDEPLVAGKAAKARRIVGRHNERILALESGWPEEFSKATAMEQGERTIFVSRPRVAPLIKWRGRETKSSASPFRARALRR